MFRRITTAFKRLEQILATPCARTGHRFRGHGSQALPLVSGAFALRLLLAPAAAQGDPATALQVSTTPRAHLTLGPKVAAIHRDGGVDSSVGGELSLVRLAPADRLRYLGVSLGAGTFASYRAAPRLSCEVFAATAFADVPIGVSVGASVDTFREGPSQAGVRGTLWTYVGVAPFVSLGRQWGTGAPESLELEIGLRIPFSIARW